jgi:dienelactone hydrolase
MWIAAIVLAARFAQAVVGQSGPGPEIVAVHSGNATLRALLWRPSGRGPFPAILLNHGSGRTQEQLNRLGPYENQAEILGPVFARHGYVFLFPFRRGVGMSADQGESAIELMDREFAARGQDARNALQLQLLEHRELDDATEALNYLRHRPEVDANRIAVVAHSFGGSLTILQAAKERDLRAVVIFSGAGYSWDRSAELRARLLAAAAEIHAPCFFIHAANDYSVNPGTALDARLAELGKPHRLKIYPSIGRTPDDGHDFPFSGIRIWEADVFAFLDETMHPSRDAQSPPHGRPGYHSDLEHTGQLGECPLKACRHDIEVHR